MCGIQLGKLDAFSRVPPFWEAVGEAVLQQVRNF